MENSFSIFENRRKVIEEKLELLLELDRILFNPAGAPYVLERHEQLGLTLLRHGSAGSAETDRHEAVLANGGGSSRFASEKIWEGSTALKCGNTMCF